MRCVTLLVHVYVIYLTITDSFNDLNQMRRQGTRLVGLLTCHWLGLGSDNLAQFGPMRLPKWRD